MGEKKPNRSGHATRPGARELLTSPDAAGAGAAMSVFGRALARHAHDPSGRRWLFVPYDQLSSALGPLARAPARELGIVLVECPSKAATRPYHQQKLALVLTSLRHFALEQAERGVAVRHVVAPSHAAALLGLGPLSMMRAAERELRVELEPLVRSGQLEVMEHEGWLTRSEDFSAILRPTPGGAGRQARMDDFYRRVRTRLGVLMDARGKPLGGRFSFDTENRRAWSGEPAAPRLPTFAVDEISAEVCELIRSHYGRHPGTLHPEALPATLADVERVWEWAKRACLPHFGPFEDAMSASERSLFHTHLSPLLNLHRLPVRRVLDETLELDLPLASKEGFVRQILGWREYLRHVHEHTDGFRVLDGQAQPCAPAPGDGGYAAWKGEPWTALEAAMPSAAGGSLTSALGTTRDVPPAYWGARSGLRCLDEVVSAVWDDAYSHHITRLMVLSNLATLLDVSPRALTDWFWVAYADAYDWVVEPNVHAMGMFGVGDRFTTKPYVSGAAYIDKMSDFCHGCAFDPKSDCPVTPLYWAFLARHGAALSSVPRMKLPLAAATRRSAEKQRADTRVFERVSEALQRGEALRPSALGGPQAQLPGVTPRKK